MFNKCEVYCLYQRSRFQAVSYSERSKHVNPCHLPHWEMVCVLATSQMAPCFTVPVSLASSWLELVCCSAREAGPAYCPPLPFCYWQVLYDKLVRGWERKEFSKDDLLLRSLLDPFMCGRNICPWLHAVSHSESRLFLSLIILHTYIFL